MPDRNDEIFNALTNQYRAQWCSLTNNRDYKKIPALCLSYNRKCLSNDLARFNCKSPFYKALQLVFQDLALQGKKEDLDFLSKHVVTNNCTEIAGNKAEDIFLADGNFIAFELISTIRNKYIPSWRGVINLRKTLEQYVSDRLRQGSHLFNRIFYTQPIAAECYAKDESILGAQNKKWIQQEVVQHLQSTIHPLLIRLRSYFNETRSFLFFKVNSHTDFLEYFLSYMIIFQTKFPESQRVVLLIDRLLSSKTLEIFFKEHTSFKLTLQHIKQVTNHSITFYGDFTQQAQRIENLQAEGVPALR